jgi:putative chitinase
MSRLATIKQLESELAAAQRTLAMLKSLEDLEVASVPAPLPIPANDAGFAFRDIGAFYDFLRGNKMLGPKISPSEYQGCEAILKACAKAGWSAGFTAYALATAYLETAATMQPIHEKGGNAYFTRMYDIKGARPAKAVELGNMSPGDGAKYHGRGYVQLTGKRNYEVATRQLRKLGFDVDLVANPDLALRPDVAAAIMVLGMSEGWFTARKLSDDLPLRGVATFAQFKSSRDIINGKDKDDEIAAFALDWQTGLQTGGYRIAA